MKTVEEKQPQKRSRPRPAKLVPLARQQIILRHLMKKGKLKSLAEDIAYEAGRAVAEVLQAKNFTKDLVLPSGISAEEVLETIYQSIEDNSTALATANRMREAMAELLGRRQAKLLKQLPKQPGRKKRS